VFLLNETFKKFEASAVVSDCTSATVTFVVPY